MIIVKVSISDNFPLIRQLPKDDSLFSGIKFVINEDIEECDYWIVFDNLLKPETVLCCQENIFFFAGEPSTVRTYNREYIRQFAKVITNQKHLSHSQKINSHTCLPWLVGIKYDKDKRKFSTSNYLTHIDFKRNSFENKTKLISVITSNKILSKGHKQRLEFVFKLKEILGDQLEVFGSGFNDIPDKISALQDFKYTLVIENSQHKDYWTEKLADAFLCNCYPIYYGCSNIYDYFDKRSLTNIDITKPQLAIRTIQKVIQNNTYERNLNKINESKNKILTDYNFFYFIKGLMKNSIGKDKKNITLLPEKTSFFDKIRTRVFRNI